MKNTTFITVWRWEDAPEEFKALSRNGGDEDWVAFVPDYLKEKYIGWMDSGSAFGCCCVDEYPVKNGLIRIGAHS